MLGMKVNGYAGNAGEKESVKDLGLIFLMRMTIIHLIILGFRGHHPGDRGFDLISIKDERTKTDPKASKNVCPTYFFCNMKLKKVDSPSKYYRVRFIEPLQFL